jgi:hypothetical protein
MASKPKTYEQAMDKIVYLESLVMEQGNTIVDLRRREVPLSKPGYDWIMNLQYKVKHLSERVKDFETGDVYVKLKQEHKTLIEATGREIKKLKKQLADANASYVTMSKEWTKTLEESEKEFLKVISKKDTQLRRMEKRALKAEHRVDEMHGKLTAQIRKTYAALTKLEDEKGKVLKLTAQLTKDSENSSIPSSMNRKPKAIVNNREKTGRKPGGQPGHAHHPRRLQEPTTVEFIPVPDEYLNTDIYVPTGRIVEKQTVEMVLMPVVTQYWSLEYRNRITGVRVSADFPGGLTDDVTYGSTVKALSLLLVNHCNVSLGKVSELISDLTGGTVKPSAGFLNKLAKEFSDKTQGEQEEAIRELLLSPVMNVDFTGAKVNGKRANVLVCTNGATTKYFARKHKGFSGVKNTPIEIYMNILVHDHDVTFYKFGSAHQECLDHVLRYLKGSALNEKHLTWNRSMRELIREMIHFRKHLDTSDGRNPDEIDPDRVKEFESKYDDLLELAKAEYEYDPPSDYYKDGHNLYLKMAKYKKEHLLFLHDYRVPWTNSIAERKLRLYKRKQHQVMTFRSFEGLEAFCNTLGVLETLRDRNRNMFEAVTEMFGRQKEKTLKSAAA